MTTSNVEIKHIQHGKQTATGEKFFFFSYFLTLSAICVSIYTHRLFILLERRAVRYDSPVGLPSQNNLSSSSNSISTMATSTSSHPTSNSSLFAYGSTITGGNTVRQRALAEPATNSLLITSERFKAHTPSTMRPARQSSTTTMPSAYMTYHHVQRNASQDMRSHNHQDKSTNSRGKKYFRVLSEAKYSSRLFIEIFRCLNHTPFLISPIVNVEKSRKKK